MRWLWLLPLLCSMAFATNAVYLAPTSAGGNTGADCADALVYTYFNTSGNWSATPTGVQIGPGTTVHFCGGTYTGSAGASEFLVFQGNGSSGNPVTTVCDAAATFTATYWSGSVFDVGGRSYLTLNGTNCTIQATANGTSLANQQDNGCGICGSSDTSNTIIENWTIQNIYVHVCSGSSPSFSNPCPSVNDNSGGGNTSGIQIWEGTNDTIAFNTITNVHWGIVNYYGGSASNSTNILVYSNTVSGMDHGVVLGDQGANSTITSSSCSSAIHDNDFSNMQAWDASGGGFHHDAIHAWANNSPGSNYQGVCFYNNYVHGNLGFYPSGAISSESVGNANYFFNNVIGDLTNNTYCADGLLTHFTGTGNNGTNQVFVNNTIDPGSTPCSVGGSGTANSGTDIGMTQASGTIMENNLALSNATTYVHGGTGAFATVDYNVYGTPAGSTPFFCGSTNGTFSTWQSSCGFDAHGQQTSVTVNSNYTLPSGSAAIGAATNLTSLGITALDIGAPQTFGVSGSCGTGCLARPSSGAWDAGAYPYSSASPTVTPAPALGMFAWDWDYLLPDPNLNFGRCQRDFGGENPMRIRLTALRSF